MKSFCLSLGLALLCATAQAHTNEYLDTLQAPHGGQLRMAGIYHFELVMARDSQGIRRKPVSVYVTDHAGNAIPTAGAFGVATLYAAKRKATVRLLPDGDNRLAGTGKYESVPDMNVVVSITLPGADPRQARFTPLRSAGKRAPDPH